MPLLINIHNPKADIERKIEKVNRAENILFNQNLKTDNLREISNHIACNFSSLLEKDEEEGERLKMSLE